MLVVVEDVSGPATSEQVAQLTSSGPAGGATRAAAFGPPPARTRRDAQTCRCRSARRKVEHAPNERITVSWLWIILIVILVLAVLGYFGRGRFSR
jgi:hypothetical protein